MTRLAWLDQLLIQQPVGFTLMTRSFLLEGGDSIGNSNVSLSSCVKEKLFSQNVKIFLITLNYVVIRK